ncbi:MAG: CAF17-like 4Fe-4S cluster assembly/insertion protein YgfZ [Gammaproteobacteria bacterium]
MTEPSATGHKTREPADDLIADLPDLAVLRVGGKDAADFLAGQLTSDVRALLPGQSQLAAWCTPKGRVIVVCRVLCLVDQHLLVLPDDLAVDTLARLRRYVLRSRVELSDERARWVTRGYVGPGVGAVLRERLGALPERPGGLIEEVGSIVVALGGPGPRYLVLGAAESVRTLREAAVPALGSGAAWRVLEILSGVPVIHRATSETYLPQMLNLEALGGLSFQKGCYPGQEVIARLKYRGEIKRRMFLAGVRLNDSQQYDTQQYDTQQYDTQQYDTQQYDTKGDGVPTAGQPLFQRLRDGPPKVGEVLAAERHLDGVALLAVIDIAASDKSLHLGDPSGPVVSLMPLPYAVPG